MRSIPHIRVFYVVVSYVAVHDASPASAALLNIQQWRLTSGAENSATYEVDVDYATVVQNPFQRTDFAAIGLPGTTTALTAYDFAWSNTAATFLIQCSHQAEDTGGLFLKSLSDGIIRFSASQDVLLSVDAAYAYDLPFSGMDTVLSILVGDLPGSQIYYNGVDHADTFLGWPASGTLTSQGQALLPGGKDYILLYRVDLVTRGTSELIASGDGYFSFQFQPVPEPSAFIMTLLGGALISPRLRCRRPSRLS